MWQGLRGGATAGGGAWRWEGLGKGGAPQNPRPSPPPHPTSSPTPVWPPAPRILAPQPPAPLRLLCILLVCLCVCGLSRWSGGTLECLQLLPTQAWGLLGLQQEGWVGLRWGWGCGAGRADSEGGPACKGDRPTVRAPGAVAEMTAGLWLGIGRGARELPMPSVSSPPRHRGSG